MIEVANGFESAYSRQEIGDLVTPSPFAIAYHIQPCFLLQANGERDHFVHPATIAVCHQGIP
tara:strand:+ start:218 stop:403 length:186 start_codon:yes stop_codon:yes gene_type:complete